jgi:hypothetical protein
MTDAYQCDGCGEFNEGTPTGRILIYNLGDGEAELCEECAEQIAEIVRDELEVTQE